jgi:hypothetical protein
MAGQKCVPACHAGETMIPISAAISSGLAERCLSSAHENPRTPPFLCGMQGEQVLDLKGQQG